MCKCIEKVKENVKSNLKANFIDLDCVLTNTKSGNQLTGQRISIDYNHVLKNGGVRRKQRNSFVSHEFCPFCGVKYE